MKKKSLILLVFLMIAASAVTQVVTSDPGVPLANKAVTIYFNAAEGSGGLAGYTGDVYAHTGVRTNKSSGPTDWKFVKTDWGENTEDTRLIRISDDYYKLEITPDILSYYGVTEGDTVTHLAFVFRSGTQKPGGGFYEGKGEGNTDIFLEVFEEGLNLTIVRPDRPSMIVNLNDTIDIFASASKADSVSLYLNGEFILKTVNADTLSHDLLAEDYGSNKVLLRAAGETEAVEDSFSYYVGRPVVIEDLPGNYIDGINYTSDTSLILVLYAPGKENAYLLWDHTAWTAADGGAMKLTSDLKRFWIELEGLEKGREYPFQYLVDGYLRIADPYAEKFLDPSLYWYKE